MQLIDKLFDAAPELALFVTIAVGYLVGKIRVGTFVLGGIAGTLLVGVAIGQFDVKIDPGIKTIFFALFIYAVGYQGGPQFFHALNLRSLNQLLSAFLMCVVGLLCVLVAAWAFKLDRGMAAGLAAGGLTQSAIIGTAGEAINKLDVSAELKSEMQTNVAVGYAICYIFGSLGPIIMVTWFLPRIMRWNIREEAKKLAETMSGGKPSPEPGQFEAIQRVHTRAFRAGTDVSGKTVETLDSALGDAAIEAVVRDDKMLTLAPDLVVREGDVLIVTGVVDVLERAEASIGPETTPPKDVSLLEENREIILTSKTLIGRTLKDLHDDIGGETRRGVFLTAIRRLGRDLPLLPDLELHRGDELQLTGRPRDLDRVQKKVGYEITAAPVTDFIFFGVGMALGIFVGLGSVKVAGVPVTLGTGGGCLLYGLLFGWLRSVHPHFGAIPTGATNFLRDFGLAVFVGIVGITAGPQALKSIQEHGISLFLLGIGVTLVPQVIVFFFSYYVLRITNPIEALACVAGGRSANPGFAALLNKAGNATPVVSFTVTYAVANVFLTLWGPLIIGIVHRNPG